MVPKDAHDTLCPGPSVSGRLSETPFPQRKSMIFAFFSDFLPKLLDLERINSQWVPLGAGDAEHGLALRTEVLARRPTRPGR